MLGLFAWFWLFAQEKVIQPVPDTNEILIRHAKHCPKIAALKGAEISAAKSKRRFSRAVRLNSWAREWILGLSWATVRGVNALLTMPRAKLWRGGSVVPRVLPTRSGGSLIKLPRRPEDQVFQSLNAVETSSKRVSTQMLATSE